MQNRISKSLDSLITRTIKALNSDNIRTSYTDRLVVELLGDDGTFAYRLLENMTTERGISVIIRRIIQSIIESPKIEAITPQQYYNTMCNMLMESIESPRISTAHVVYYAAMNKESATAHELRGYGIEATDILRAIDEIMSVGDKSLPTDTQHIDKGAEQNNTTKVTVNSPLGALDKYSVSLTELARRDKLDPVIGRDNEIARLIQILSRRKKCNPILIGEAGVGKSAIVEGLALSITKGHVPKSLENKEIYALDMAMLIAGTKFRGEFEERMSRLVATLEENSNIILFIDEIHTIVGAGAVQGSLDVANILKPALARGTIQTIGATTPQEYSQTIAVDTALDRRFQPIKIEEPTLEATRDILSRLAPYYATHHGVEYTPEALDRCVMLADKLISNRRFPDKAIDIMDEAGVWARIECGMNGLSGHVTPKHVDHVARLITGDAIETIIKDSLKHVS